WWARPALESELVRPPKWAWCSFACRRSTCVSLLLGLYRPTSGRILLDSTDLSLADLPSVHNHISVVSQVWRAAFRLNRARDPHLFSCRNLLSSRAPSAKICECWTLPCPRHTHTHTPSVSLPLARSLSPERMGCATEYSPSLRSR